MTAEEHLYYGFGHVAHAIAMADGKIQREEEQKLHDIVVEHLKDEFSNISISEIIFDILKDEHRSVEELYDHGINNIDLGSHHMTEKIKDLFLNTAVLIADAFPPFSKEENEVISKLKADLARLSKNIII
ncbi:MAG: hypothetical protein MRY83_07095 [Flavobacteriales bacterium]|nr:hypothetical protein [Flavobacteriales bacterium]